MDNQLFDQLTRAVRGDVVRDEATLLEYSHDASLFEVKPSAVVFPKNREDIESLVNFVSENKDQHPGLSLTARAAGTDMGGGPLTESIVVAFTKYFNHSPVIKGRIATTEPGVYYRDFEALTLQQNLIFPSYPASKNLCAMGGIFNNNSGGEKSLRYGKTEKYVRRIKATLADGKTYDLKKLTREELEQKKSQAGFEGELYRRMHRLLEENYDAIMQAKPAVLKNSAGYALWNIYDRSTGTFDLTQLWVGAQGTLGLALEADIELVPVQKHRAMLIMYLHDVSQLGNIINTVLAFEPESFESYDDNTLKLALMYFPEFARQLGFLGMFQAALAFLPAFFSLFTGRKLPSLILQADFTGDDTAVIEQKISDLQKKLQPFHPVIQTAREGQENKYWLVRRESFNLLRKKIRDKHTAPFIDDFVIKPEYISEAIPRITAILNEYPEFFYTVAGHVGSGNFHIIPLVDIKDPKVRAAIPVISDQVYTIIAEYGGSISGEHNDGLIRTPYLEQMYGANIIRLFEETKNIFDPKNIFNPGKKVYASLDWAMEHLRTNW